MGETFARLAQELSAGGRRIEVETCELDIERGGKSHDLLDLPTQERILKEIKDGQYDVVMAAPPCMPRPVMAQRLSVERKRRSAGGAGRQHPDGLHSGLPPGR